MLNDENNKPLDNNAQNDGDNSDTDEIIKIMNARHRNHPMPTPDPEPTREMNKTEVPKNISHNSGNVSRNSASNQNVRPASHSAPQDNISHNAAQPHNGGSTPVRHAVSLDDFADSTAEVQSESKNKKRVSVNGNYISGVAKVIIYLAAVISLSIFISIKVIKIGNDVFAFVKPDKEITVEIPEGATTAQIAEILKENGVIKYPSVYKKYSAFRIKRRSYLTGEYAAGTHKVNPTMNYDQLLEELSVIKDSTKIVRITIPEGYTVKEILKLFESNGMKKADEFTDALENYEYDYRFMDEMKQHGISDYRFDTKYGYRLEGYLFPDTYDFYVEENPVSAISKLLDNFNNKFDNSFYDRCNELGFTVDEIITLASIIESEGNKVEDYAKISSVFHNRLANPSSYPYLESDATVQYALGVHKTRLEPGDTDVANPYNTYKYKGLPPGPICNPGYEAIYAALYPESTNYYYFLSRSDGVTVYSTTYNEHLNAIEESNRLDAELKKAADANQ